MISEDSGFVKALKDFVRARVEGESGDDQWEVFDTSCVGWTTFIEAYSARQELRRTPGMVVVTDHSVWEQDSDDIWRRA